MKVTHRSSPLVAVFSLATLMGCAGSPAPVGLAHEAAPPPSVATIPLSTAPNPAVTEPPVAAAPLPADAPIVLKIVVEKQTGYDTPTRAQKLKDAVEVAEKVLNDPEYRAAIVAYPTHHGLTGFTQATMYSGGNMTSNASPMEALLRGNGPDGQIHVWLAVEHTLKNEVGHTVQNAEHDGITLTKAGALDRLTVAQLADHIVHEHMHRIGYQHAGHATVERCDSIPYAYGRTVCAFATNKYGSPGPCDKPADWPAEQFAPRDAAHGPRC